MILRPPKVAIVQRVIAAYNVPFYEMLSSMLQGHLTLFHGPDLPSVGLSNSNQGTGFGQVGLKGIPLAFLGERRASMIAPGISRSLQALSPDVVILEGMGNMPTNLCAIRAIRGIPYIWWTLGEIPGQKDSMLRRLALPLERVFIRNAGACIGYSTVASAWLHRYGAKATFTAVNSTCDLSGSASDLSSQRDELYTNAHEPPRFIFVGQLTPAKRVGDLLHASAALSSRGFRHRLTIVGQGPSRQELETTAANIGARAQFLDHLAQPYAEIQDAWCLVLPGRGGLAIQQAMANGVPFICCVGDGTEYDYLRRGAGIQFREADIESLVTAMSRMMDPTEARIRSDAAIMTVVQDASITRMCGTFMRAIESVVKR